MENERSILVASAIVLATGVFWGFYWIPVRALYDLGLSGASGTLAITVAAAMVLVPVAVARRQRLRGSSLAALAYIALGGAAFALYSVGFVYGRVAIVILLFYLTPVWSTLIGSAIMGWPASRKRVMAIVVGLLGLGVMLGADGDWPIPRNVGEWMGLMSGLLWSVSTTGMRVTPAVRPVAAAAVFAAGAAAASLLLVPFLAAADSAPPMGDALQVVGLAGLTGALWWALSVACLMWATVRLEPARVGILLMAEVLVGAVSAALLAGEHLHILEIAGGALVLLAGLFELWPERRRQVA